MSLLSVEELKALVEQANGTCVSIYMPTIRAGAETQQNSIRFKNLIKEAETQLEKRGIRSTEANDFLKPATNLDRDEFWQHQDQGLVIFVAENFFRYYQVPLELNELVVVNDRFHVKPLLPLLTGDGQFYILALSQQRIRLFEGSRHQVKEIELEGVPQSIEEALQYDETAKAGQFRISTSKGGTNNSFQHAGTFHGQGSPDRDQHQKDILQFFYAVDQSLQKYFQGKRDPLILAGVEYLLPLYKEANTYQHLLDEGIPELRNSQIVEAEELHEHAWTIVEPYFTKVQQEAIDHYHELSSVGKTSTDIKEAIPAAFYGRVEQLFVAVGVQQWGNFDPDANQITMHNEAQPGDEDLLNTAAIQTILNGGIVYAVKPDQVPDDAPLAAVFRY